MRLDQGLDQLPENCFFLIGFFGTALMPKDALRCIKDITKKNASWYVHLELSARELKALGEFVSQWSLLESMIQEYSETLSTYVDAGPPKEIYSDSFRKRVRALRALAPMALPNHPDLPQVLSV